MAEPGRLGHGRAWCPVRRPSACSCRVGTRRPRGSTPACRRSRDLCIRRSGCRGTQVQRRPPRTDWSGTGRTLRGNGIYEGVRGLVNENVRTSPSRLAICNFSLIRIAKSRRIPATTGFKPSPQHSEGEAQPRTERRACGAGLRFLRDLEPRGRRRWALWSQSLPFPELIREDRHVHLPTDILGALARPLKARIKLDLLRHRLARRAGRRTCPSTCPFQVDFNLLVWN